MIAPVFSILRAASRAVLLVLVALCLNTAGLAAAMSQAVEEDSIVLPHATATVFVALDRVGLVSTKKATSQQIADLGRDFGLEVVLELEGHSFVLGRSEPLPRKDLLALVRALETKGMERDLVREAGMVLRYKHALETPMLLTDEFIVRLEPKADLSDLAKLNQTHSVEFVLGEPLAEDQYLLRVTPASGVDALTMANEYHAHELTRWAQPNFWSADQRHESVPADALFGNQWHHRNTGQGGGLDDADVDTSWAWDYTLGSPDTVIAIIDDGFDIDHEDLAPNVYVNPLEIAGNGIDDDGNGYVDDVNGWDFVCEEGEYPDCGDNDPRPDEPTDNHGTSVAGMAVARSDNLLGVAGSCPHCRFLPIRRTFGFEAHTLLTDAIRYVALMDDVDILSNSWGCALDWAVSDALWEVGAADIMIFFAAENAADDSTCTAGTCAGYAGAIAVSSSSNLDLKVTETSSGDCIDFMAPSHRGYSAPYRGTLDVTTTDRSGSAGYNDDTPSPSFSCAIAEPDTDYTSCFGGTSAATPLAAGVAGLVKTLAPGLSEMQVERLIQDTTDKIEPGAAEYDEDTGFSAPASGIPTHAWGRVNAWEAVRVVADPAAGGRGGVDVFMRDNRLDWGNATGYEGEQGSNVLFESPRGFIGHWHSRDIKVDAPPYHAALDASDFDSVPDEKPSATPGDVNRVYVRVRNRGPLPAAAVNVKLHWTQFGTALPVLPADFWTAFPGNSADPSSEWHPLDCSTGGSYCSISDLGYSGASVATSLADQAQVVRFEFPAPAVDPELANHFCLLAIADSPDDPVAAESTSRFVVDQITPNDNNVTHRNYHDLVTTLRRSFKVGFLVRNPTQEPVLATLVLRDAKQIAERKWQVSVEPFGLDTDFKLAAGETAKATLLVILPAYGEVGEVEIIQERLGQKVPEVMGGLLLRLVAEEKDPKAQGVEKQ